MSLIQRRHFCDHRWFKRAGLFIDVVGFCSWKTTAKSPKLDIGHIVLSDKRSMSCVPKPPFW